MEWAEESIDVTAGSNPCLLPSRRHLGDTSRFMRMILAKAYFMTAFSGS